MAPVAWLAVVVMSPLYRLTTQTGVPAARSGSGAPNVAPLAVPAPVLPVPVQDGLALASQPARQKFSTELPVIGKLCEMPSHPLSRSPPTPSFTVVRMSWLGPPDELAGQRS